MEGLANLLKGPAGPAGPGGISSDEMKKFESHAGRLWQMLDELADNDPDGYKAFLKKQAEAAGVPLNAKTATEAPSLQVEVAVVDGQVHAASCTISLWPAPPGRSLAEATAGSVPISPATKSWANVHIPFADRSKPKKVGGRVECELLCHGNVLSLALHGTPVELRAVLVEAALRWVERSQVTKLSRTGVQLKILRQIIGEAAAARMEAETTAQAARAAAAAAAGAASALPDSLLSELSTLSLAGSKPGGAKPAKQRARGPLIEELSGTGSTGSTADGSTAGGAKPAQPRTKGSLIEELGGTGVTAGGNDSPEGPGPVGVKRPLVEELGGRGSTGSGGGTSGTAGSLKAAEVEVVAGPRRSSSPAPASIAGTLSALAEVSGSGGGAAAAVPGATVGRAGAVGAGPFGGGRGSVVPGPAGSSKGGAIAADASSGSKGGAISGASAGSKGDGAQSTRLLIEEVGPAPHATTVPAPRSVGQPGAVRHDGVPPVRAVGQAAGSTSAASGTDRSINSSNKNSATAAGAGGSKGGAASGASAGSKGDGAQSSRLLIEEVGAASQAAAVPAPRCVGQHGAGQRDGVPPVRAAGQAPVKISTSAGRRAAGNISAANGNDLWTDRSNMNSATAVPASSDPEAAEPQPWGRGTAGFGNMDSMPSVAEAWHALGLLGQEPRSQPSRNAQPTSELDLLD